MTDEELIAGLKHIGKRVSLPCPDGLEGCLVHHFGIETDPVAARAIDRIEALAAALEAHENHMAAGQTLAVKYLVPEVDPDSIGKDEFISRIIEHFDGPDQRAVQAKARAALEKQP
jgi:hypothetical protein